MRAWAFVLVVTILAFTVANAEIPQIVGYQGRVTDNAGNPVADGNYTMRFRIYDDPVAGTPLWDSNDQSVALSGGVFSVLLGGSPQPPVTLDFDEDYWLLVTFDGEDQLPRKPLASVGYAYMASGLVPGTIVQGDVSGWPYAALIAENDATSGDTYGLYGTSWSDEGQGVLGEARATAGYNYGVLGRSLSPDGRGVAGSAVATAGSNYGVHGTSSSTIGSGVYGFVGSTEGACSGVYGRSNSSTGYGVRGSSSSSTGTPCGVYGVTVSPTGRGVYGLAEATTGPSSGVRGTSQSTQGRGVYGEASAPTGTTYGVYGTAASTSGRGVFGAAVAATGTNWGGRFECISTSGVGVGGVSWATTGLTWAVHGYALSESGRAVYGEVGATTGTNYSVYGYNRSPSGRGVYGTCTATSGTNYGVYGRTNSGSGYGGYFHGDVHVTGELSKGSGSFLIDHPLDPENSLLRHSFVESPEHLLIYRGKTALDHAGTARVDLPDYFRALTKESEASIHLTPSGTSPFLVSGRWDGDFGGFTIHGEANREVFWEVLAARDDPVIHQLGRPVEETKGPDNKYCDRGELLYPAAYGFPAQMGRDYEPPEGYEE
jgi:hypothetical protein